ncbi:MAG: N-succinyldiaminopimelate aminotransferase [Halioglobus sp.]|jgi:N-succinyldiaminopimelate aminotransferase
MQSAENWTRRRQPKQAMNRDLVQLHPYPFEKLRALFAGLTPAADKSNIALSIGEPKHRSPDFVLEVIADNLHKLTQYPSTLGLPDLREAIARWLTDRFELKFIDPQTQVLPVNGTREALFAFAQTVVDRKPGATVICPNPFYQIYEGAGLLAGAKLQFLNCIEQNQFIPDFDSVTQQEWLNCQLLYICNPGNPTGAITPQPVLQKLIGLAKEYDFVIASDECYSEIYPNEELAPPGLLQACASMGDQDYNRCVVFHSLSKRSNLPGLRSGFVAGDAKILQNFLKYRTYHGCAMPVHHQLASIAAWGDETHVIQNRQLYRDKFSAVLQELQPHLDVQAPEAAFYLWPRTPIDDTEFAKVLYAQQHVTVLPGRFLARSAQGINPGENHVRMALVAPIEDCIEAAQRTVACLKSL